MSRFRAYINPTDDNGVFTGFVEVTEDVDFSSMGSISQQIDNDEYNVGLLRFNQFTLKLTNESGRYSDVGTAETIFKKRRGGSRFRLTWEKADDDTQCGIAICGSSYISPEITVFEGVINDEATRLNIVDQKVQFTILTIDSVFKSVATNFASLSNGNLFSAALLTVLNQTEITKYLTVSAGNINVGLDLAIDTVADFENTTVKEALDDLLFASNSVLYIEGTTVIIRSRDADATSSHTFIGQASNNGIENIIDISDVSSGQNNLFNFWTWADTTLKAENGTSIADNGLRKKEISFDMITNTGKRQSILDEQRDEYGERKQELKLTTTLTYETLALMFLNKVNVDYPTVYAPANIGDLLPYYGLAVYGAAIYPIGQFSLTIDVLTDFKILGIVLNTKQQTIEFKLREI